MKIRQHLRYLCLVLVITMMASAPVSAQTLTLKEAQAAVREAGGIRTISGKVYSTGKTGWQTIDGKRYYFWPTTANGHKKTQAATGWQTIGGRKYCFSDKGVQYIGKKTVDGRTYYFIKSGGLETGWRSIGANRYYFWPADGTGHKKYEMAAGKTRIGSRTYYFNKSGKLRKGGLVKSGKNLYYADEKGVLQKKWVTVSGRKYYFWSKDGTGHKAFQAAMGRVKIDGTAYLFDDKGVLQTGFIKFDGKYYYAEADGSLKYGWQTIDGKKYYFRKSTRAAETGWSTLGGNVYYFNSEGVQQTGWLTLSGARYYLNAKGRMQTGWQTIGGSKYYFSPSDAGGFKAGQAVTGKVTIDGTSYTFDSSGKLTENASSESKPAQEETKPAQEESKPAPAVETGLTATHDGITVPVIYTESHGLKLYGKVDTTQPFAVQVEQSNLRYYEAALQALKKLGKKWQYSNHGSVNNFMWAFDDIVNCEKFRSACCSSSHCWIWKDFGESSKTSFTTVYDIGESKTLKQLYNSGQLKDGDLVYAVLYDGSRAILHDYIFYDKNTIFDTGHGSDMGWHRDSTIYHTDDRQCVYDTWFRPITSGAYYDYKVRKLYRPKAGYIPHYYRNEKGILTKMPSSVK